MDATPEISVMWTFLSATDVEEVGRWMAGMFAPAGARETGHVA